MATTTAPEASGEERQDVEVDQQQDQQDGMMPAEVVEDGEAAELD